MSMNESDYICYTCVFYNETLPNPWYDVKALNPICILSGKNVHPLCSCEDHQLSNDSLGAPREGWLEEVYGPYDGE